MSGTKAAEAWVLFFNNATLPAGRETHCQSYLSTARSGSLLSAPFRVIVWARNPVTSAPALAIGKAFAGMTVATGGAATGVGLAMGGPGGGFEVLMGITRGGGTPLAVDTNSGPTASQATIKTDFIIKATSPKISMLLS